MRDNSKRRACKRCRKPRGEGQRFSARGLCVECQHAGFEEWAQPDRAIQDPEWWARYRRGVAASVGAVLTEDLEKGQP